MFLKITCISLVLQIAICNEDYAHGFGKDYDWVEDLDAALDKGEASGKPVMIVLHKSWCPRCIELASKFAESEEIHELSDSFVMVNLEDDVFPKGSEFDPESGYVPRVLFVSKEGKPNNCVNKWGNPEYKYYFYDTQHIANCMREVLDGQ